MKSSNDPVDLDSLIHAVKTEVSSRDAAKEGVSVPEAQASTKSFLSGIQNVDAGPKVLGDFLRFDDEKFVKVAYNYILRRDPDQAGLANYLQLLRSGKLGKVCILGALRFSQEGEIHGATIKGLDKAYKLSRIFQLPVIGYVLRSCYILLRLPVIFQLNEAPGSIETSLAKQNETLSELQRQLSKVMFTKADRTAIEDMAGKLQSLADEKVNRHELDAITRIKESCNELQRQLSRLEFAKADRNSVAELTAKLPVDVASQTDLEELRQQSLRTGDNTTKKLAELESLVFPKESGFELQRQLSRLEFAKADKKGLSELASTTALELGLKANLDDLKEIASELETRINKQRAALEELLLLKESGLELQRQLSRLEFTKADRKNLSDLSDTVSMELAAKATLAQLSDVTRSLEQTAGQDQIDEIHSRLDGKASLGRLDILASLVEAKAEKAQVDELSARLEGKAEQQSLSELSARLESKADQQQVQSLSQEVSAQLAGKADQFLLNELSARVDAKAEQQHLQDLATHVGGKAEHQVVNELWARVDTKAEQQHLQDLATRLDAKAEQQHLQDLSTRLDAKAEQQHLQDVATRLDAKPDHQHLQELAARLDTKAEQQQFHDLVSHLNTKSDNSSVEQLGGAVHYAQQQIGQITDQLEQKAAKDEIAAVAQRVTVCEESKVSPQDVQKLKESLHSVTRQSEDQKLALLDQQRRLAIFLEQARKRLPEPFSTEQVKELVSEEQHFLDSLYVSFEDRFRGSREDIKDRSRVFLPYVKAALGRTSQAPVLDVACGRGEWLQLLQESGIKAQGVDFNRVLVEQCGESGLNVAQDDALEYLRKQKNRSFSMVSAFHFIEHVPLPTVIALLDEMLRVLKPGGLALLETPNARNLLVTAGDFYRDPTHKRPIFPDTLEALAEFRGFAESTAYCFNDSRTEIRPLREMRFDDLNAYVTISRDTVWMGRKAQ